MKIVFRIIALFLLVSCSSLMSGVEASAQTPVKSKERNKMLKAITEPWEDWETLSISGKLKMAGLSLNPSLKIFMEKDSLIRISVRVPLMGEVGRAEIEGDTLLVVNKMKKTYVKESLGDVLKDYPVTLSDVQSLLLGRIAIPGMGLLTPEAAGGVDIYPDEEEEFTEQYYVMPVEKYELEEFQYAYLIDKDLLMRKLMIIPTTRQDTYINVDYLYEDKGYDISVTYKSPEKIYGGSLILDIPTEGGSYMEPIKLSSKYQRVTFQQFMKSF